MQTQTHMISFCTQAPAFPEAFKNALIKSESSERKETRGLRAGGESRSQRQLLVLLPVSFRGMCAKKREGMFRQGERLL